MKINATIYAFKVLSLCAVCIMLVACSASGPSIKYDQGIPPVYENEKIKRAIILNFGDDEFNDLITEKVVNSSKWTVVDRATLERILDEQDLQNSARFDDQTAIKIGKIAGADMAILGEFDLDRTVIKALDIETGEYLAFKNIYFNPNKYYYVANNEEYAGVCERGSWCKEMVVFRCLRYLVPYCDKTANGLLVSHWIGPNAATANPQEFDEFFNSMSDL
jgi:Curli production assembly/transport component CsgG